MGFCAVLITMQQLLHIEMHVDDCIRRKKKTSGIHPRVYYKMLVLCLVDFEHIPLKVSGNKKNPVKSSISPHVLFFFF